MEKSVCGLTIKDSGESVGSALRKMVVVRASEVAIGDLEFSYEFNRAYAHFSGVDKLVDQTLQKLRFVRQVGDAAREGVLRDLDSTQKVIISFNATGE